jgi:hypothetical protein
MDQLPPGLFTIGRRRVHAAGERWEHGANEGSCEKTKNAHENALALGNVGARSGLAMRWTLGRCIAPADTGLSVDSTERISVVRIIAL